MSLVSTLPKKGDQAKVYDVPDAELARYEALEANQTTFAEGKDRLGEAEEIAGGVEFNKDDVEAYGDICICWIHVGRRWYYRYQYCWQSCP
jgi:hypothetical protein